MNNIEILYQSYLKALDISEEKMQDVQKRLMKLTFYSASAKIISIFKNHIMKMPEEEAEKAIHNMSMEIIKYIKEKNYNPKP